MRARTSLVVAGKQKPSSFRKDVVQRSTEATKDLVNLFGGDDESRDEAHDLKGGRGQEDHVLLEARFAHTRRYAGKACVKLDGKHETPTADLHGNRVKKNGNVRGKAQTWKERWSLAHTQVKRQAQDQEGRNGYGHW